MTTVMARISDAVNEWSSKRRTRIVAVCVCLIALVFAFVALWSFHPSWPGDASPTRTPEAPFGIISLQVAASSEVANEILASWSLPTAQLARHNTFLDWLPLIPIYVIVLGLGAIAAGLCLSWNGPKLMAPVGIWLAAAVLIAGLFDAVENLFLLCMIDTRIASEEVVGNACPLGSAIFAWPKIVILLLCPIYLILGTTSWIWGTAYRRRRDVVDVGVHSKPSSGRILRTAGGASRRPRE